MVIRRGGNYRKNANGPEHNLDGMWAQLGYEQITNLSTAQSLTVPDGADVALVRPLTQAVRWRDDGTSPTATVGMPLAADEERLFNVLDLSALEFIEQSASAELNVVYYAHP